MRLDCQKLKQSFTQSSVFVVGSGEAFSSELGNTSYLIMGGKCPATLFDCGYQIPERLWKLDLHRGIELICLTHLHADHAFGIPPLLCRYWEEGRRKPLTILGWRGCEKHVKRLMEMAYPGLFSKFKFKVRFLEITERAPVVFGPMIIRAARTRHSVLNYTLRVDFKDPALRSVAVSGDGQITEATQKLVGDVGLLLQEVYSRSKDIPVHADLRTIEPWVAQSKIGRVGVAHHARSEISAVHKRVCELRKKDRRWFSLTPGMILPLA